MASKVEVPPLKGQIAENLNMVKLKLAMQKISINVRFVYICTVLSTLRSRL